MFVGIGLQNWMLAFSGVTTISLHGREGNPTTGDSQGGVVGFAGVEADAEPELVLLDQLDDVFVGCAGGVHSPIIAREC